MSEIKYAQKPEFNFEELAKQHGYVKARQIVQQITIKQQQHKVYTTESNLNASKHDLRMQQAITLGTTYGPVTVENVADSPG